MKQQESYRGYEQQGDAFFSQGDYEKALKSYEAAIDLYPYSDDLWIKKGNALASLKRFDEAIECYDTALYINPNREKAWHAKGLALHFMKRYDEAIECFDRAIEIHPDYDTTWHAKGVALYLMGRYLEALRHFQKALDIYPLHKNAAKFKEECIAKLKAQGIGEDEIRAAITRAPKIVGGRDERGGGSVIATQTIELKKDLEAKVGVEVEKDREERIAAEREILEAQNMITYLEKLGLKMNHPREMLIEAVGAFSSKDYEEAKEFAEKARRGAEKLKALHKRAVDTIAEVWERVRDIINMGGSCTETEVLLDAARDNIKGGNYERALHYAERASEVIETEGQSVLKKLTLTMLSKLKSRVEDLKNAYPDWDWRPIERNLVGIDTIIIQGQYKRALELIAREKQGIEEEHFRARRRAINQQLNMAQTLLMDAREILSRIGHELRGPMEKDLDGVEDILSDARTAFQKEQYNIALSLAERAKESARNIKRSVQRILAEEIISSAESMIHRMERDNVDIDVEIKDAISRAKDAVSKGIYIHAIELASQGKKSLMKLEEENYKRKVSRRIGEVERILNNAKRAGLDIGEVLETLDKARESYARGRYQEALDIINGFKEQIDDLKAKSLKTLAEDDIIRVQELMTDTEQIGISIDDLREQFDKATRAYESGKYKECMEYLKFVEDSINLRRQRYDDIIKILADCGRYIDTALEMGAKSTMIEEAKKLKFDAERALGEHEILKAEETAKNAFNIAHEVYINTIKKAALEMITSIPSELKSLHECSIDIQPLNSLLDEAKMAFERGRYEEAYNLVSRVETLANDMRTSYLASKAKNAIDYTKSIIAESIERGIECAACQERIEECEELFKASRYESVVDICREIEVTLNKMRIKALVRKTTDRLFEITRRIAKLRKSSVPITSDINHGIQKARDLVAEERYNKALELLDTLSKKIDELEWRYNNILKSIDEIKKILDEHGDLGEGLDTATLKRAETALSNGELNVAEAIVNKFLNEYKDVIKQREKDAIAEKINQLKQRYSALQNSGYEIPEIYKTITSIEDAYSNDDIDAARSLINKVDAILRGEEERVLVKMTLETIAALKQRIKERETKGLSIGNAPRLLEDAMRAIELERYNQALALCKKAENEMEELEKNAYLNALRSRIESLRSWMNESMVSGSGVNDAITKLIQDAEEAIEKGDYTYAEQQILKAESALEEERKGDMRRMALDKLLEMQSNPQTIDNEEFMAMVEKARIMFEDENYQGVIELYNTLMGPSEDVGETMATTTQEIIHMQTKEASSTFGDKPTADTSTTRDTMYDKDSIYLNMRLAEASIKEARALGLNVSEEEEEFKRLSRLQIEGQFERLENAIVVLRERVDTKIRHFNEIKSVSVKDLLPQLQILKSMGIEVSTIEDSINDALNLARNTEFKRATEILDYVAELLASIRTRDFDTASNLAIKNLEATFINMRTEGTISEDALKNIEDKLKRAKEQRLDGRYEEAIATVNQAMNLLRKERHRIRGKKAEDLITIVEGIIERARAMNLDITDGENLLFRAKEAYSNENFVRAIDLARAARESLENLIKSKQREYIESELSNIVRKLESAKMDEGVRNEILDEIDKIKTLDVRETDTIMHKIDDLKAKIKEAERSYIRSELLSNLQSIKEGILDYKNAGILKEDEIKAIENRISLIETYIDEGKTEDAISEMDSTRKMMDEIVSDKGMRIAEDALMSASNIINEAKSFGINISKAEDILKSAKESYTVGKYADALRLAKEAKDIAFSSRRACEEALEIIRTLTEGINELKEKGINITEIVSYLNQSKRYIKEDLYAEAVETAKSAMDLYDTIKRDYERAADMIAHVQNKWTQLKREKIEIPMLATYVDDILSAMKKGEYSRVISLAENFDRMINDVVSYHEQYKHSLAEVKDKISQLKAMGAMVDVAVKDTKEAMDLAEKGEFEAATIMLKNANNQLERIEEVFKRVKGVIDEVRMRLVEARKMGLNVREAEDKFNDVIKLMNMGDYESAEKSANEALKIIIAQSLQKIAGE